MPVYHLLRTDGTVSDIADYPELPAVREEGQWVEGKPDPQKQPFLNKDINKILEDAFLSVLPKHLGQPYLTPQVMLSIASLKQSVTDFNRLGLYALSKQMIEGIDLPVEMAADKQTLVNLFPN